MSIEKLRNLIPASSEGNEYSQENPVKKMDTMASFCTLGDIFDEVNAGNGSVIKLWVDEDEFNRRKGRKDFIDTPVIRFDKPGQLVSSDFKICTLGQAIRCENLNNSICDHNPIIIIDDEEIANHADDDSLDDMYVLFLDLSLGDPFRNILLTYFESTWDTASYFAINPDTSIKNLVLIIKSPKIATM